MKNFFKATAISFLCISILLSFFYLSWYIAVQFFIYYLDSEAVIIAAFAIATVSTGLFWWACRAVEEALNK